MVHDRRPACMDMQTAASWIGCRRCERQQLVQANRFLVAGPQIHYQSANQRAQDAADQQADGEQRDQHGHLGRSLEEECVVQWLNYQHGPSCRAKDDTSG